MTGIDISDVAITESRLRADREQVKGVDFLVMDAEALEFDDSTFDLVCGLGILHHLDLRRAYAELARTLKPDGSGIFVECLAHNPPINLYRRATPQIRTEDEHPLLMGDLELAKQYFGTVQARFTSTPTVGQRFAISRPHGCGT